MEEMIYYYVVFILISLLSFGIGYILLKVYKNEKKRKSWIKNIKPGDTCRISISNDSHIFNKCEIMDIYEDKITVEITISKRWIYPPITKNND
jgi:hypothetical protein